MESVFQGQGHFTGLGGAEAEMTVLLLQQFVETAPAMHIAPDMRFSTSLRAEPDDGAPMT